MHGGRWSTFTTVSKRCKNKTIKYKNWYCRSRDHTMCHTKKISKLWHLHVQCVQRFVFTVFAGIWCQIDKGVYLGCGVMTSQSHCREGARAQALLSLDTTFTCCLIFWHHVYVGFLHTQFNSVTDWHIFFKSLVIIKWCQLSASLKSSSITDAVYYGLCPVHPDHIKKAGYTHSIKYIHTLDIMVRRHHGYFY